MVKKGATRVAASTEPQRLHALPAVALHRHMSHGRVRHRPSGFGFLMSPKGRGAMQALPTLADVETLIELTS